MNCTACGLDQVSGAIFCRQCGTRLAGVPGPAPVGDPAAYYVQQQRLRVHQNLQPLGILWIIFGIYRILSVWVVAAIVHHMTISGMFNDAPPFLPHLLDSFVPAVALLATLMGVCAIVTGYALLTRKSWGRILAMVFGILALLKLPFGTALGIYTLWVLGPRSSGVEWEAISSQN
jgi:hypothetical protein